MSLKAQYINAIERKLAWLRFIKSDVGIRHFANEGYGAAIPIYRGMLEASDTYYMEPKFSGLVDHARKEMPADIQFDPKWLQSDTGFIWLDQQFEVPRSMVVNGVKLPPQFVPYVRAIAWRPIPPGENAHVFPRWEETERKLVKTRTGIMEARENIPPGSFQFACFETMYSHVTERGGFGSWSYFILTPGDPCSARIEQFEEMANRAADGGAYIVDERRSVLHEIRWVYAALHLMSLRLATTVTHATDRATRRRAEREGQQAPPNIRVITLRRLEQDRQREAPAGAVDWQWQWEVRGHWRNQFYASEGTHKPVFIEAYIKGPEDKPLKPGALKLFVGKR